MAAEWLLVERAGVPVALREAVGGHPLVARLLAQRGFDPERARAYLDPDCYSPASPHDLRGLTTAVQLLGRAIASGEAIRIWGDFDVDGQTSTAVLYEALRARRARVDYQLPGRAEGHGLHNRAVDCALRDGVSVLLTCDTGIGEADTVARGVAAGLTIIITDHHDLPATLPPAQAVVDPKAERPGHPLRELSGVGVAYMVARALLEDSPRASLLDRMLDLVALGLVADVATQIDDVRYLIQRGLVVLRQTHRPGLRALAEIADLDLAHLNEEDIGFQLGPRLNAAGRLGDPSQGLRLLLTRDENEAQELAQYLEALNRDRQAHTEALAAQVEERLVRVPGLLSEPAIILDGENWQPGILGLVAGELARRHERPAILIAHRKGLPSVGSARSIEGIDIHQAIATQRHHLLREGGHPMAAGFSITRQSVAAFRHGLLQWLRRQMGERPSLPPLPVDADLPWDEVNTELAGELLRLAPFGPGNPRPVFMLSAATLIRTEDLSRRRETAHRRLHVSDDEARPLTLTWFNAKRLPQAGERIDVAFHLGLQHWKGKDRRRLELVDWRPAALAPDRPLTRLVAAREIVDWRHRADRHDLLSRLRADYGNSLSVWAEGLADKPESSVTRAELPDRLGVALAVLTPPPGPEALRWALTRLQPQVVYLLPPHSLPAITPVQFLGEVAGMLRVALRSHDGRLDVLRMAARIGARRAAIVAALRGLEAAGKIGLRHDTDGLRAYLPHESPPEPEAEKDRELEGEHAAQMERALQQARDALAYLLRETRAYRQTYADLPVQALFYGERTG